MQIGPGLVEDATLIAAEPGSAPPVPEVAVRAPRRHDALAGSLLVPDRALGRLPAQLAGNLSVGVLLEGGAGGLLALARRDLTGLRLAYVLSTVRDLDNPAGATRRVLAAAEEIGGLIGEVEVVVGLPWTAHWEAAVEVVEAAGCTAAVRSGTFLADQLRVLVEADLPYRVLPGEHPCPGSLALLAATAALVDDDLPAARRLLDPTAEPATAAAILGEVPGDTGPRLRRRLRAAACADVDSELTALAAAGVTA